MDKPINFLFGLGWVMGYPNYFSVFFSIKLINDESSYFSIKITQFFLKKLYNLFSLYFSIIK